METFTAAAKEPLPWVLRKSKLPEGPYPEMYTAPDGAQIPSWRATLP